MYHILFIDDDDMLLESAWRFFKGINYQMDKAANAKEGLKRMQSRSYDCIILDLKLPDLDGYEVLRQMRLHTSTPIIILSNYTEVDRRIQGLRMGADDYANRSPLMSSCFAYSFVYRTAGNGQLLF